MAARSFDSSMSFLAPVAFAACAELQAFATSFPTADAADRFLLSPYLPIAEPQALLQGLTGAFDYPEQGQLVRDDTASQVVTPLAAANGAEVAYVLPSRDGLEIRLLNIALKRWREACYQLRAMPPHVFTTIIEMYAARRATDGLEVPDPLELVKSERFRNFLRFHPLVQGGLKRVGTVMLRKLREIDPKRYLLAEEDLATEFLKSDLGRATLLGHPAIRQACAEASNLCDRIVLSEPAEIWRLPQPQPEYWWEGNGDFLPLRLDGEVVNSDAYSRGEPAEAVQFGGFFLFPRVGRVFLLQPLFRCEADLYWPGKEHGQERR